MTHTTQQDYQFTGQTNVYHGKVRDVYTIDDSLLIAIASDRLSAFDVILPREIPFKGQVLTQLAQYFLEETADTAPNCLISVPHPNVSIGYLCKPFAIEIIVRSVMVGHAWRTYSSGEHVLCGVRFPEGLQEFSMIDPVITPTTKATSGHDEDISYEDIISRGIVSKEKLDEIYTIALKLFAKGQQMASERGLLLADTKYEFGEKDGVIYVIDEIHTPDSSRYFDKNELDNYIVDKSLDKPDNLSKEFVREWLMQNDFSGQAGQDVPDMTDELIRSISERYIALYETITGKKFVKNESENDPESIEKAINKYLETNHVG